MTTTTAVRSLLIAALAAIALLIGFLLASGGLARATNASAAVAPVDQGATTPPGITVTGTSTATGTPDTLRLDLGVSVTKGTVAEAMTAANSAMASVQKALRDNGVAAKDLKTNALSVQPQYEYPTSGVQRLTGYTVTQGVLATIRKVDEAGRVIDAATKAGGDATVVNSIGLDVDDPEGVLASARGAAIENAKAKAMAYAEAAGRSVGQVLAITETSSPVATNPKEYAARDSVAGSAVPISAGSQEYAVSVTVTFALG